MPQHIVDRTGETGVNTRGRHMTIIAYKNAKDIDVEFEDGARVYHRAYVAFKLGNIAHPDDLDYQNKYIGKTHHNKYGELMTIVEYARYDDFWVSFEDGSKVHCTSMGNFTSGNVISPKRRQQNQSARSKQQAESAYGQHLGETNVANCGLHMRIVEYVNCTNVTVEFEDGQRAYHRGYYGFTHGMVLHPSQKCSGSPIITCGFTLKGLAYTHEDVGNFFCTCNTCGYSDILSIPEMKAHTCK